MEIRVPELGESITEGTVSRWLVQEGGKVQRGDALVEIETDKVNLEIPAEADGVLTEIRKHEGDTVLIGEVVGMLGSAADQAEIGEASAEPAVAVTPTAADEGKQAMEVSAAHQSLTSQLPESQAVNAQSEQLSTSAAPVTPSQRRLAREQAHDVPSSISPSGAALTATSSVPAGQADLLAGSGPATVSTPAAMNAAGGQTGHSSAPLNASTGSAPDEQKPVERIRMTRRRQTIARRLVEAQQQAAMLTTFNEIDMSAVMDVRQRRKDAFLEKHGVKLGFMSFFTKAVIGALKTYPLLNAEIQGQEIVLKKYYDIGVAVSTEEGLVVPVVRDADRLSFAEIERNIMELADKARNNRLKIADLEGGTFTITNGGVFGSLLSTPIINPPQVGILGMHKIQTRPITVNDNQIENRPMMYVALSYDHRIVDGREAVSFLVKIKELLEDPESLWFDI